MADSPEFPVLHSGNQRIRVSRFSPRFRELLAEGFVEKTESARREESPGTVDHDSTGGNTSRKSKSSAKSEEKEVNEEDGDNQ